MLESSWEVPMSGGKAVINIRDMRRILEDIRLGLPQEVIQAQKIVKERNKLLEEAKADSDRIIKVAEDKIRSMISESQIVKSAQEMANNIVNEANFKAKEIRSSSNEYVQNIMNKLEEIVSKNLVEVRTAKQIIQNSSVSGK